MKVKQIVLSIVMGLALMFSLLIGMAIAGGPTGRKGHHVGPKEGSTAWTTSAGAPTGREMDLTLGGSVYEINPDARGTLWLSEFEADQVWQLNPATGVYTIYHGLVAASDARMDAAGDVWWSDFWNGNLGRISLTAVTVTTWTLPGAGSPLGIAFDDAGQVWVTDDWESRVYRFSPTSTQVCSYTLPDSGLSSYIVSRAGGLWLGDYENGRILKLDPAASQFTQWQLPAWADPVGLAVDGSDNLWWADSGLGALARLEPAIGRMTTYTLPLGEEPVMLAFSGESVWYTEVASGTLGVLNPAVADGVSTTVVASAVAAASSCSTLGAGSSSPLTISTDTAMWTPGDLIPRVNSGGWRVYELPWGAYPWGIAVRDGVWVADQGRDKLLWLSYSVYLPIVMRN
jgi:streptogramin lyase